MSVWKVEEIGNDFQTEFHHWHFDGDFGHDPHVSSPSKLSPFLSKIEAWCCYFDIFDSWLITAIRLTWYDGEDSGFIGVDQPGAEKHTLNLQCGEYMTSVWLGSFPDDKPASTWFGYIYLKTNKGQVFEVGQSWKVNYNWLPLASGMILGVYGHYTDGYSINGLGFAFLQDLQSATIDIQFDVMPDPSTIIPKSYDVLIGDNTKGDVPLSMTISESKAVTNTTSTSESWSETLGIESKTTLEVPLLAEEEFSVKFDVTHESTDTTSYSDTTTLSWSATVPVPPREYYEIDLLYYTADVTINYQATVTFYCNNGTQRTHIWPGQATTMTAGIAKIATKRIPEKE